MLEKKWWRSPFTGKPDLFSYLRIWILQRSRLYLTSKRWWRVIPPKSGQSQTGCTPLDALRWGYGNPLMVRWLPLIQRLTIINYCQAFFHSDLERVVGKQIFFLFTFYCPASSDLERLVRKQFICLFFFSHIHILFYLSFFFCYFRQT